jgi:hypothetical protein
MIQKAVQTVKLANSRQYVIVNIEVKSNGAIGIYWKYCLEISELHGADGISRSDVRVSARNLPVADIRNYGCEVWILNIEGVLFQLINNLLMYANAELQRDIGFSCPFLSCTSHS